MVEVFGNHTDMLSTNNKDRRPEIGIAKGGTQGELEPNTGSCRQIGTAVIRVPLK